MIKNRHYRGGYQVAGLVGSARDLRKQETPAEKLLWQLLRNRQLLGFKFRRQHQFGDYVADFYCHEARLVIECNGGIHDESEAWHHDRERDAWMAAQGLRVLRITNHEVLTGIENVLEKISAFLPSPTGRRAGEEGLCGQLRPSPQPSPRGRGRRSKSFVITLLTSLVLLQLVSGRSGAQQSNSPQSPVEISGEPRHHPKFENEFVRIWDVTVPAADATLWHAHRNDNVVVTFGDASLRIETVGREPIESQWKFGEVRFAKATYVHRAMNVGKTSFHNLTIELLKLSSLPADVSNLPKQTGREPILENDRVRVYRLSLPPGESAPTHTHPLPGLAVMITGGEIEITVEGRSKPEKLRVNSTDVRWRAGAVTHSIKNSGSTRFEAVDIELK